MHSKNHPHPDVMCSAEASCVVWHLLMLQVGVHTLLHKDTGVWKILLHGDQKPFSMKNFLLPRIVMLSSFHHVKRASLLLSKI